MLTHVQNELAFSVDDSSLYFPPHDVPDVVAIFCVCPAKVFDALEKAGTDVMQSTAMFTQDVVAHRFVPLNQQVSPLILVHLIATIVFADSVCWLLHRRSNFVAYECA